MKRSVFTIIAALVPYAIAAFAAFDINAAHWTPDARGLTGIMVAVFAAVAAFHPAWGEAA